MGGTASTAESKVSKKYISAQQLLEDSFALGFKIFESGFRPDFIVGVWRGGTPVGIAVQELLHFFGVETDHIAIRTSFYSGINQQADKIRVHGLQYIVDRANADDSLLIVDDVYDTGLSIHAIIEELKDRARLNAPREIRVATAYYKPANNKTTRIPDYCIHEVDEWLVFPHELHGLTTQEILKHKTAVAPLSEMLKTLGKLEG